MSQPVLSLLPSAARSVGPSAGLVEGPQGGVVFVFGMATYPYAAGDELGRRLAAVQLVSTGVASAVEVAAAFSVTTVTLWRWRQALQAGGVSALAPERTGPKGPTKLTGELTDRIVELDRDGHSLRQIAAATGVSTATVRVALGRVAARPSRTQPAIAGPTLPCEDTDMPDGHVDASGGDRVLPQADDLDAGQDEAAAQAHHDAPAAQDPAAQGPAAQGPAAQGPAAQDPAGSGSAAANSTEVDTGSLVVLARPAPRSRERAAARAGDLVEAPVVLTEGAQLPLAGSLLVLPGLEMTGLLQVADGVFGPMRKGFYALRATLLTLVLLALLRSPRAEGLTRLPPADLGRLLGLDRAPEVKTLRRKLTELAGHGKGADLQAALGAHHAAVRPEAMGFLYLDGHVRVYSGSRQLPKTHIARMRLAGPASEETWVGDADGDPVLVLIAPPSASLAAELRRTLPDLRALIDAAGLAPDGSRRRATVVFDRGGYSPAVFAELIAADFDLLTYYKGSWTRSADDAFRAVTFTAPDGTTHTYQLAERPIELAVPAHSGHGEQPSRPAGTVTLRLIVRASPDGHQTPILTSRATLSIGEVAWRMSNRWRQENYFKYGREHFALDALDSYADGPADLTRLVPNPAKTTALAAVATCADRVSAAQAAMTTAIEQATLRARQPGNGGKATVDPAAARHLAAAEHALEQAQEHSRQTISHLPLGQVRPGTRTLETERKLLTHAIRLSAYNAESALARLLRPHYARGDHEARALLREAFTLTGDLQITGTTLHIRLDPASAPRRSRALAALCTELTATATRYPGTDLTLTYSIKDHPNPS